MQKVKDNPIALKGRVPCLIIGKVEKGDPVYVGDNGVWFNADPRRARYYRYCIRVSMKM